jgi:sterol carrier protein 2
MTQTAYVTGIAMTPFAKPSLGRKYEEMVREAVLMALRDAGLSYDDIQEAYCSYVLGDTSCGQRALYGVGLTGIPIINVNNSCASGSSALYLARCAILSGQADCVLALGFEQMASGPLKLAFTDRASPTDVHESRITELKGPDFPLSTIGWFAAAAHDYMAATGMGADKFAQIAVKARRHAALNPNAVFRDLLSVEEIMASTMVVDPLTKFQCSPPTSGAAAAILCSPAFARKRGLNTSVAIKGQTLATDMPGVFSGNAMDVMGADMARKAVAGAYSEAGVGPEDIQVVEMHDCFTSNEVISYELLGLAKPLEAERMIVDGDNTFGGRYVINPSGGLIAKGHPIGATGLAQCFELVTHLRGQAGARQVEVARIGLQHNLGIGGACVVTVYERTNAL